MISNPLFSMGLETARASLANPTVAVGCLTRCVDPSGRGYPVTSQDWGRVVGIYRNILDKAVGHHPAAYRPLALARFLDSQESRHFARCFFRAIDTKMPDTRWESESYETLLSHVMGVPFTEVDSRPMALYGIYKGLCLAARLEPSSLPALQRIAEADRLSGNKIKAEVIGIIGGQLENVRQHYGFIFGFIKRVSDPSARARALSYLGMNSHLDPQQIISIYQEIKKLDLNPLDRATALGHMMRNQRLPVKTLKGIIRDAIGAVREALKRGDVHHFEYVEGVFREALSAARQNLGPDEGLKATIHSYLIDTGMGTWTSAALDQLRRSL